MASGDSWLILDLAGDLYSIAQFEKGSSTTSSNDILGEISIPYFVEVSWFYNPLHFQKECFAALKIIEIQFLQRNYEQFYGHPFELHKQPIE